MPLNLIEILKEFYNPKITKVEVTVEGSPDELYAQNMEYHHQYDENMKHFGVALSKKVYSCMMSI